MKKLKEFKVTINTECEYYAEDEEDCLELVLKDFPVDDEDIDIEEIK